MTTRSPAILFQESEYSGRAYGLCGSQSKGGGCASFSAVMAQISRGTGHNCPSSSVQLAVARVLMRQVIFPFMRPI